MGLGKQVRLNRIFGHPSRRLCSVAVDHFCAYQKGLPAGLINVPDVIDKLVQAQPDAITMHKGMAKSAWGPYAGCIPLIINSAIFSGDDNLIEQMASAEEVVRLGGDAVAAAIGVRGPNEARYLKLVANLVREADRFELPMMVHIYPRDFSGVVPRIVHDPENIMWAVRCGIEVGADVIKVPYTGDVDSFREIVATSPVPVVAAGGPKADTLEQALRYMGEAVEAGGRGATIGRNIWGMSDPTAALLRFKEVIHGCGV